MVPMLKQAVSRPQKRDLHAVGTQRAAMAWIDGKVHDSPTPMSARHASSGVSPRYAADGVAACAALQTTSPTERVVDGESVAAMIPAGRKQRKYPVVKAAAIKPFVVSEYINSALMGRMATLIITRSSEEMVAMAQHRPRTK